MEEIFTTIVDVLGDIFGGIGRAIERSLTGLFGSSNARYLKKLRPQVAAINALEPKYQALTDAELKEQTVKFRKRLASGETMADLLVEAFNDGGHADDGEGANQHPQDGEERAKLVHSQRVQGKQKVFTNMVEALFRHAQFSVRKASIGSSLAA